MSSSKKSGKSFQQEKKKGKKKYKKLGKVLATTVLKFFVGTL